MIDTQIHAAIRSYKRAGKVKTLAVAPFAYIWVPESQGAEYRACYGDRVITIPDAEDGNGGRKFNAILNRSPCPWTVILDDDVSFIGYFEGGVKRICTPDSLRAMIEHYFVVAAGFGVHLWGLNVNKDPLSYKITSPFSLLAPILGPFTGHLEPVLRYDDTVFAKDDYDFWLQNIWKYHKALRVNKYHYEHDHGFGAGGFASLRTLERERASIQRMYQKWGHQLFQSRENAGNLRGGDLLNSLCSIPIKGI